MTKIYELLDKLIHFPEYMRHLRNRLLTVITTFFIVLGLILYKEGYLLEIIKLAGYAAVMLAACIGTWKLVPYIELKEWRRLLNKLIKWLQKWIDKRHEARANFQKIGYESMEPEDLLEYATHEELANLAKVLGIKSNEPTALVDALTNKSLRLREKVGRRIRRIIDTETKENVKYREIIERAYGYVTSNKRALPNCDYNDAERAVLQQVLSMIPEEGQKDLEEEIKKLCKEKGVSLKKEGIAAGILGLAKTGGFTTYMLASSWLAAAAGTVGASLPFVVYTTMSKIISVAIGPFGWGALGLYTAYKIDQPEYVKILHGVVAIAAIRNRLIYERDKRIYDLDLEIKYAEYIIEQAEMALINGPTQGVAMLPKPRVTNKSGQLPYYKGL